MADVIGWITWGTLGEARIRQKKMTTPCSHILICKIATWTPTVHLFFGPFSQNSEAFALGFVICSSRFPPHSLGQWRGVRGEKWGCVLLQERSWCCRSSCPAMEFLLSASSFSSSPPAHLAAPRTLIWRENKNVFISQERRRTLEWNHRVKAQKGILGPHTACCGAIFSSSISVDLYSFSS